jgi:hypothetical protein
MLLIKLCLHAMFACKSQPWLLLANQVMAVYSKWYVRAAIYKHPLVASFSAAIWSDQTGNASSRPGAPAAADWAAAEAAFAAACGFFLAADLGVADMI